jgi:hypothetical protein
MTQFIAASVLDAGLTALMTAANAVLVCSAAPINYAQAQLFSLGSASSAAADFSLSANSGSRTLTLNARTNITALASGIATHVALVNTVTQNIVLVSACTPQALTNTDVFSISPLIISAAVSQS